MRNQVYILVLYHPNPSLEYHWAIEFNLCYVYVFLPTVMQDPSVAWQADPSQWAGAYYGYGYDVYAYGVAQDPSLYAYGAYAAFGQYPQQARI